jgi:crotonobetainyl-CoA hydratase
VTNHVRVEKRGKVLLITLDRPPVNAIADQTQRELHAAFRQLQNDKELRVGVVTSSSDRIFSAGWDLKSVSEKSSPDDMATPARPGGWAGLAEYWELEKPVIAAVKGICIGGGFELALACDLIVASDTLDLRLPEMQRGFLPDAGAVQRLPRRIPYNIAMDMLLTGRSMYAEEAAHWGLVNKVVPTEDVVQTALDMAEKISEGAPLAVAALKVVMPEIYNLPLPEAMSRLRKGYSRIPTFEKMMSSDDVLEGARAFVEKRKPNWKGE